MDIARKRVGASCQLVLDLYERLQGQRLKSGLDMQDVTEQQNKYIEIAEHTLDVVAQIDDSQMLDADVRKADHEISMQICLILTYLVKVTYTYGRYHKVGTLDWEVPLPMFPHDWDTAHDIALDVFEGKNLTKDVFNTLRKDCIKERILESSHPHYLIMLAKLVQYRHRDRLLSIYWLQGT